MQWSDGTPFTARDVAFTYQYLLDSMDPAYTGPWAPDGNDVPGEGETEGDGAADNPLSLFGDFLLSTIELQSVEAVDDTTVTMTTAFPTSLILGAYIPILPEHIWKDVTFASAATDFQADPPVVGTGPFQVVEWRRGEFARFEKNPNYWGKQPYLDEVIFQFYANEDAMGQALKAGTVDYIRGVIPEQFESLDADPNIVGVERQRRGLDPARVQHLRQADRGRRRLDHGRPRPGLPGRPRPRRRPRRPRRPGPQRLRHRAARPSSPRPSRPSARIRRTRARSTSTAAAAALEAAGYVDSNGDGSREDKEGKEINLRIYFPDTDSAYPKSAQFIADWWGQIGIPVTIQSFDSDTLTSLLYTPEAGGTADYDIELWGWASGVRPGLPAVDLHDPADRRVE